MRKFIKIAGIILLVLFSLIVISLVVILLKAKSWRDSFESSIQDEYAITSITASNDLLNAKIEEYILSEDSTDFIEYTPAEISQFLFNIFSEMTVNTSIEVLKVYSQPGKNLWEEYILLRFNNSDTLRFWLQMDVTKDDMQTAQLYVNNITINGFDVDKIYPAILSKINQGIAEALVTANENGFVGRMLDNIELEEESIVIKGSEY